jgi:L-fuculose-phosphate aldolase
MVDTKNIRASICKIGKLLYDRDLTDSSGGNISVRDGNYIYINPRRAGHDFQWEIDEDTIIVTDICKMPVIGEVDRISREAATHYYIYQNFPEINSVVHGHPFYMMAFGAAHMDIPPISEGTRAVLGNFPVTNVPEVVPGSIEQAEEIVKNFKKRRELDPGCPLICNIPFHGTFAAGETINDAFLYTEVANNCAKILIYRQSMFGNDPRLILKCINILQKRTLRLLRYPKMSVLPAMLIQMFSAGRQSSAVQARPLEQTSVIYLKE